MLKDSLSLLPYKLQNKLSFLFNNLSELENILFGTNKIEIEKPIFICGLPRSGTTLLTQILHQHNYLGSFEYRDLPFYKIPIIWSKMNMTYYGKVKPSPRIHGDNLDVGLNAPDAFEELVWKEHINEYLNHGFCMYLNENYNNTKLQAVLRQYIQKILFLRKKIRYLSKGNYNIFRLHFILRTFPSAKIIICYRDPINTAKSLERMHFKFNKISEKDKMFKKKLMELCHYEFGPQRKAIYTDKTSYDKTLNCWNIKDEFTGYLFQWLSVYKMVNENYLTNNEINKKIFLLDYDEFVKKQNFYLKDIFIFCELEKNEKLFKQQITVVNNKRAQDHIDIDHKLREEINLVYSSLKKFKIAVPLADEP